MASLTYEFELETRAEAAPSTSQPTKALAATTTEQCSPSTSTTADQLSDDVMSLFVKKFGKYLRRSYNPSNLKAYEFELETRAEAAPSTSQPTKALAATTTEQCSPSTSTTADQLSDDVMSLFVKKFGKYLRRSYNPSTPYNNHKNYKDVSDMKCFNYERPGHFVAECNRPKKDDRYKRDDKRTDDRYKKED
ncbi:hypothetical protein F511_34829 [Dorcoceras hygrometricum]|uniref:Uncharacterized protein n=1 Tax=Dorcoceras hygrometricum TaxID=472368 RepID=A0A2Z7D0A0_9LAMI|nr:hypothetical protein F511_34829 [Dorcoceras hygrometricum]